MSNALENQTMIADEFFSLSPKYRTKENLNKIVMRNIEIVSLKDTLRGYTDIARFDRFYFRTYDGDNYCSGLGEISEKLFKSLKKNHTSEVLYPQEDNL